MSGRSSIRRVVAGLVVVGAVFVPAISANALPPATSGLIGTWTNVTTTSGIAKLVVSSSAAGVNVDTFTRCSTTTLCELGKVSGVVFGTSAGSTTGGSFRTNQAFTTYNRVMLGRLISTTNGPRITIDMYVIYKDGVHYDSSVTLMFRRVGPATSTTRNGVTSTTYPSGRQSRAPNSFLGTWRNINPATTGVVKYVITRASNGSLLVHEFGACEPTACDNGTHSAISYGSPAAPTIGNRFLVPANYGFKFVLSAGSINLGVLTVRMWAQFTDGSNRSNYSLAERFTH